MTWRKSVDIYCIDLFFFFKKKINQLKKRKKESKMPAPLSLPPESRITARGTNLIILTNVLSTYNRVNRSFSVGAIIKSHGNRYYIITKRKVPRFNNPAVSKTRLQFSIKNVASSMEKSKGRAKIHNPGNP